jgi:hypothetical protein
LVHSRAHLVHFLRGKNYDGSFLRWAYPKTILILVRKFALCFSNRPDLGTIQVMNYLDIHLIELGKMIKGYYNKKKELRLLPQTRIFR